MLQSVLKEGFHSSVHVQATTLIIQFHFLKNSWKLAADSCEKFGFWKFPSQLWKHEDTGESSHYSFSTFQLHALSTLSFSYWPHLFQ